MYGEIALRYTSAYGGRPELWRPPCPSGSITRVTVGIPDQDPPTHTKAFPLSAIEPRAMPIGLIASAVR
jgi:hypothetical protein